MTTRLLHWAVLCGGGDGGGDCGGTVIELWTEGLCSSATQQPTD
jgi:NAD(P)H-hydrate repair Nnr-like enzyme with NAD(P)H-hydrate epimerase domain